MIDGALTEAASWKVRMHLSTCEECADFAQSLEKTVSIVKSVSSPKLSDTFDAALAVKLSEASTKRNAALGSSWISKALYSVQIKSSLRPAHSRSRMMIATPFVAAAVVLLALLPLHPVHNRAYNQAPPASSFTKECIAQHESDISEHPFGDPSAQALMQSSNDEQSGASDDQTSPFSN
jgi:anti-sigma factor RsiW